jgi:hypothetical protein
MKRKMERENHTCKEENEKGGSIHIKRKMERGNHAYKEENGKGKHTYKEERKMSKKKRELQH